MIVNQQELTTFIEEHINGFHQSRITGLEKVKLLDVLKRKNPYLFRAKYILTAEQIVRTILDAHLSSQEETMFGEFLEKLAIFIAGKTYGGRKSGIKGIDLEFEKDNTLYLVSIKSGPNWGNSRQINQMHADFTAAKKTLRTNTSQRSIECVNGCCYGKQSKSEQGDYIKVCGQKFWELISGNADLYLAIIEPIAYRAKEKNEEFQLEYARVINKFVKEFTAEYCSDDGEILWSKIVEMNSKHEEKPTKIKTL